MGHTEDDAINKHLIKLKTHRQNQLEILVSVWFKTLYRIINN